MDSSHSLLSKYFEIMPWNPPLVTILAPIVGEGMKGTRGITGVKCDEHIQNQSLILSQGAVPPAIPFLGFNHLPIPTMEDKESSMYL